MRWLYLVVSVLFIGFVLSRFTLTVDKYLRLDYNMLLEAGLVCGQVMFQWMFLWRRPWAVKGRYAFELITVSLLGAVMLVPLVWWAWMSNVSVAVALVYFFAVVAVMFVDHWRRVKRMGLPWFLCGTWVLYRCLLLVVIMDWDAVGAPG